MKKSIVLISACYLFLIGCSTTRVETIETKVQVPIACIKGELPEKPLEPTRTISITDDIYEKTKKILAELDFRKAYEIKLEAIIEGCK